MHQTIRIGTRGSQLALYQANIVKEELERKFPSYRFSIVIIKTKGDKILDVPLSKIGDKGLFTKELEIAMFDHEIDMAVHSLKDLPTRFPEGVELGAVLKRGEVRDALISSSKRSLGDLAAEDVIATSSLRRKAQLLRMNKDFRIVEIRGNVNTRIRKMEEGYCTVMVMAAAGLQRLGLDHYISELIDPEQLIPACSQGAIAVEIRSGDPLVAGLTAAISDRETLLATQAERTFLRTLEGGCQIPVGSYSRIDGDHFTMKGFISGIDGTEYISMETAGPLALAEELAEKLANRLLENGGREILQAIRPEDLTTPSTDHSLSGRVFISTRAPEAGDTLPGLVASHGATLLSLPMIEIRHIAPQGPSREILKNLENLDWLFFTSRNGVVHFFRQLVELTGGSELPASLRIAAVGAKTAAELEYYGYAPSFTANSHGSAAMAAEFTEAVNPINSRILVSLGNLADNTLEEILGQKNSVQRINVYETTSPAGADPVIMNRMADGLYDLVLFTSPSTFSHFTALAEEEVLAGLKIGSIGSTTTKAIQEAGYTPLLTAAMSSSEGLVDAIVKYYKQL